MLGITHLAAGLVVAAVTQQGDIAGIAGVAVGSLLPDIDSPNSTIGRLIPVIPRLIPHRTITHTIWVALLAYILWPPLGIGIAIHIILDCFTQEGVPLFWPIQFRIRVPVISKLVSTGGLLEWIICGLCWGYLILLVGKEFAL